MAAPRCQHVALRAVDLDRTHDFWARTVGLEVANFEPGPDGVLALRLADEFILRYEPAASDEPPFGAGIRFIGIELDSRTEVDIWHRRLTGSVNIIDDMRPRHTTTEGPYGFVITDPDGYPFKIFHYTTG